MGEKGYLAADRGDWRWWIGLIAAFIFVLLLNPGGFIGGGGDDWHYLNAARCWREFGPCLPHDHWQARWPIVAPIAAMTALFGESRLTVSIAPLVASGSAVVLLALIGNRLFGRPVGWIASLLFLTLPAFTFQLTQPSVESTEAALVFAGFLSILRWQSDRHVGWAFAAGLAFSLAFQVRETAVIAAVLAFAYVMVRSRPQFPELAWAVIGFAAPLLVELLLFTLVTGDPLWRRELALSHTQLHSSELVGGVSNGDPPFFNADTIANWRKQPGVYVHWSVDGLVNLLVNITAGLSLPLVPILILLSWRVVATEVRRQALVGWLAALSYIAVLIYALALDPKPRIMLVPLAISTLALALLSWSLHQRGRRVIAYGIWAAAVLVVIPMQVTQMRLWRIETAAGEWLKHYNGRIETDENTRHYLALVETTDELPGLDGDAPYLLFMSPVDCPRWLTNSGFSAATFAIAERAPIFGRDGSPELCLFRYQQAVSANDIRRAILRATGN